MPAIPTLAQSHPQVVHFVVALLLMGVLFRLVSLTGRLTGRLKFTNHAAATLMILGMIATAVAIKSGDAAHGPVERIPGARAAVQSHEQAADWTHDIFLGVAVLELVALGMALSAKAAPHVRWVHVASAAVGVWGATTLYQTAELGGQLVYNYAGGPGLRSGAPEDVSHLLMAGLYNQSQLDRKEGRKVEAARLVEEMGARFGSDTTVRFLMVESLLKERENPAAAMAALDVISVGADDARLGARQANLRTDIFLAMGLADSAKATLDAAIGAFPQNPRLKTRRDSLP